MLFCKTFGLISASYRYFREYRIKWVAIGKKRRFYDEFTFITVIKSDLYFLLIIPRHAPLKDIWINLSFYGRLRSAAPSSSSRVAYKWELTSMAKFRQDSSVRPLELISSKLNLQKD